MELKPGKLLKVSYANSKYSLTTVLGALAKDQPLEEEWKRRK